MKNESGFSLIEILVAVMILSVVLVASAQAVSRSIQSLSVEEHRIYAAYLAEEMADWLNTEREINWQTFTTFASSPPNPRVYCVNMNVDPSAATPPTLATVLSVTGDCTGQARGITGMAALGVPQIFHRVVELQPVGNPITRINVLVRVRWNDYGQNYEVPVRTSFTIHE